MKNWVSLFVSPNGRIGRRTFWHGCIVIVFVDVTLLSMSATTRSVWLALPMLLTAYPVVCIFLKRLRDTGRSALLLMLPVCVTTVGLGLAVTYNMMPHSQLLGLATFIGLILALHGLVWIVGLAAWIGLAKSHRPAEPAAAFD